MHVRTSDIKARLSALETYVGEKKESRGMTLTSRIEAQHRMLVALGENQSETNRRLTRVEERVTGLETEVRGLRTDMTALQCEMTEVRGTLGTVLHGVTAIKNLVTPPDDPAVAPPPNGAPPAT